MATRSFIRNIEVSKPTAVKKIHSAMKANEVQTFKTSIKDIDTVIRQSRRGLASKLTQKY